MASLQISGESHVTHKLYNLIYVYAICQVSDSSVMRSKQIFFTLSPDGLTQFSLDSTCFIDLERWLKEAALHEKISKIRTFEKFRKWKSFKCWRNALSRHKFQSAKQVTSDSTV